MTHLTGDSVLDVFSFGVANGTRGRKELLTEAQMEAYKTARQPRQEAPRIQVLLKMAYSFKERLEATPGLTQAALASEMGVSRVRVTQILNLLKLPGEIRQRILALSPGFYRGTMTENRFRYYGK
jgi:hypothetical protein